MAYIPANFSVAAWSSPITITQSDLIKNADDAFNAIISSDTNSIKNWLNTNHNATLSAYLTNEFNKVYAETNNSAVAAAGSASAASASATSSQLRAWEAEAKRMTANSYATEAEDVFVKTYASNGDGTFASANTAEYSALHWSIKALGNSNVAGAITNATAKTTPVDADLIGLVDSATSFTLKKFTWGNIKATILSSFGVMISTATAKTVPVDADIFIIGDSAATNASKKTTWANIKTALNLIYAPIDSPIFSGSISAKNAMYKPTPVTVTSWSYVTTTITLNVASHTFVVGDYIEVGGLTATTNTPNGIHLVTSVTATTIVFTYALTPTGTAGVSSATVKGYMTTNGRVESIGVGQTWQNVTTSRVVGTTYTNTTGKPIVVSFRAQGNPSAISQLIVDGLSIANQTDGATSNSNGGCSLVGIVPNNSAYFTVLSAGTYTTWFELR